MKRSYGAASVIQAKVKAILARKAFLLKKQQQGTLRSFYLLIAAKQLLSRKRHDALLMEYSDWWPLELSKRNNKMTDLENRRLERRRQLATGKQRTATRQLKRHLDGRDGQRQVQDTVLEMLENPRSSRELRRVTGGKRKVVARQRILRQCSSIHQQIFTHNYNVKYPVFVLCPAPYCKKTFCTELSYHSHIGTSEEHWYPERAIGRVSGGGSSSGGANAKGRNR